MYYHFILHSHTLGQNGLQGKIPGELASLNLTAIDLLENELTGTVPEELYTLTELNYLNLGFNKLTGTVASELGNMNKLSEYPKMSFCTASDPCCPWLLTTTIFFHLQYMQNCNSVPHD